MFTTNLLVALAIAIGLAGIIVPLLPGVLLIGAALLGWALVVGTPTGWVFFAAAVVFLGAGAVVKFTIPGKRLKESGVPNSTLWIGGGLGIVGFFVVPVVGFFAGFPLGVYVAEHRRLGASRAWPSTKQAIKAVGLSIVIELVSALLATLTWIVGAIVV